MKLLASRVLDLDWAILLITRITHHNGAQVRKKRGFLQKKMLKFSFHVESLPRGQRKCCIWHLHPLSRARFLENAISSCSSANLFEATVLAVTPHQRKLILRLSGTGCGPGTFFFASRIFRQAEKQDEVLSFSDCYILQRVPQVFI